MECLSCEAPMSNSAKFCNECGCKVESDINCSKCCTKNSSNSKFCMQCGNGLLTNGLKEKGEKIVLGNDFLLEIYNVFYKNILEKAELAFNSNDINTHEIIYILDANKIKNEYKLSVKKCFDHLIYSTKNHLSKREIEYIREEGKFFISNTSLDLFGLLSELDKLSRSVIQNVSNSTTEVLLKGLKYGASGAAAASIIPGIGTVLGGIIGAAAGLVMHDKGFKEEEETFNRWSHQCDLIFEQFDDLWNKLTEKLDEIAENTPIYFDIDENLFEENTEIHSIA